MTRLRATLSHRLALIACVLTTTASAQATAKRQPAYPFLPRPLAEAEEVALARSAAPDEVSAAADVYMLRGTEFVKVRTGTNGVACMVGRDLHEGSLYPICFDEEGARTSMQREMLENSLRATGRSEGLVKAAVDSAFARGTLRMPMKTSMAYMMSPRQVLFSSPDSSGVHVGPWWPHLMLMLPSLDPRAIGLAAESKVDIISLEDRGRGHSELIVKVPKWSDGSAAGAKSPR